MVIKMWCRQDFVFTFAVLCIEELPEIWQTFLCNTFQIIFSIAEVQFYFANTLNSISWGEKPTLHIAKDSPRHIQTLSCGL